MDLVLKLFSPKMLQFNIQYVRGVFLVHSGALLLSP